MFCGLSAFPLTPMDEVGIDEGGFARLVERLAAAKVDSIGALGSTGNYAYLDRNDRFRLAQVAVGHAGGIPVMIGIGALRTCDVLYLAEDAQTAGASAVLLALAITQAARMGNVNEASRLSNRLEPLWAMFGRKGSLRVMATAAELQGLVSHPALPLPLKGLEGIEREELESLLAKLEVIE